ncbi:hypothetical protein ACHAWT_001453 [Skeletonema menzelii]|mmetsp:Transcript_95/g.219  ORF Transcript_95/g.219 Transcript_95/m.219 type:complete len:1311 (+) Transcript_95:218-4150(+)
MALQARRFHGKPLPMPTYNFSDVPWCAKDLSGSSLFEVTNRQHFNDSIAELTLLCNEASRRSKNKALTTSKKSTTKPLSIEYIFDRIDTDDPLWGLMVRTDTPTSFKGRPSNVKASPHWKRGMLQGFITVTTFTNWKSSFRFDSLHEMAFAGDSDDLEEQMKNGLRKYDEDGSLAEELEATVKGGNPHVEGVVYPKIAEVALFGGLGCGKQLLRLVIEHLERLKSSARQNYDYIVLQATDNSVPFYESMGFTRVGCVQSKSPCPDEYVTGPVEEYMTQKNGETCQQIAKNFGVDVWDIIFLNQPLYGSVLQHQSWLKEGTKIFVPKKVEQSSEAKFAPKWYVSRENDTPRGIAKKFKVNFAELLQANKRRYPELTGNSRLMEGTRIQIANFHIDEADMTGYSHWTFPDTNPEDEEPSYMMALRLNRKKGRDALEKPVAASLSVPMKPYSPDDAGIKELLLQPSNSLAPIFTQTKKAQEPPKKPKRPTTSFGHFSTEIRSNLSREMKGKQFGEINTFIAEQWRALSDEGKVPYIEKYEESKAAFADAMKKYELELANFKREAPQDMTGLRGQDTSLLEKVVKLKSNSGISGASKYEYYYVLTFIPDLQWVHLIPMVKAGEFDDEHPEICGRPIWKLVEEDAGKEIDTTAGMCEVVTARTMNNSANADDEHWDVYDKGETPPILAALAPKTPVAAPVKPKKPATSFALFCADARSEMRDLRNKSFTECTQILASKWKQMTADDKAKYKEQQLELNAQYSVEMKSYERDVAIFLRENPHAVIEERKRGRPRKHPLPSSAPSSPSSPDSSVDKHGKRKRGRPRKHPLPQDVPLPEKKKAKTEKSVSSASSKPTQNDVVLSLMEDYYKDIMWKHFRILGISRVKEEEDAAVAKILKKLKQRVGLEGKFLKREQTTGHYVVVTEDDARAKVRHDIRRRVSTSQSWADVPSNKASKARSPKPSPRQKAKPEKPRTPPPAFTTKTNSNDIILSLLDEKYKEIMWAQYRKLGRTNGTYDRENVAGMDILFTLKKGMGTRGRFFKKSPHSFDLIECSEDLALEKIKSDLKRRMSSKHHWLGEDEKEKEMIAFAINRYPSRDSGAIPREVAEAAVLSSPKKSSPKKMKAKSYASPFMKRNYGAHIPSEPADGFPDGWVTRQIPRAKKTDKRLDRYWYSPILGLAFRNRDDAHHFATEVERSGGDESKVVGPSILSLDDSNDEPDQGSSNDEKKEGKNSTSRPLAPIFLKNYGKKKKKDVEVTAPAPSVDITSEELPPRPSRYPDRKRKCTSSLDLAAVSDGSDSVSSVEVTDQPQRKKARK